MMKRQKGLLKSGIITMMDLLNLLRYVRFVSFDPKPSAKTFFSHPSVLTPVIYWPLWPGRDGCQSALWDCFGDEFAAMLKMCPPKESHNALWQPSRPGLPRNEYMAESASNKIKRILCSDWLPSGQDGPILPARSGFRALVPQGKFRFWPYNNILYWPSLFVASFITFII